MSFSVTRGVRTFTCAVTMAAVASMLAAAQALGTGGGDDESYNVGIKMSGGDATAVSTCLNIAKMKAHYASKTKAKGKKTSSKVFPEQLLQERRGGRGRRRPAQE